MTASPFRIVAPGASVEAGLEPILNALVSLSFLNAAGRVGGDPWTAETAAALSPQLRRFMCDEGLLGRTADGARYWRVER